VVCLKFFVATKKIQEFYPSGTILTVEKVYKRIHVRKINLAFSSLLSSFPIGGELCCIFKQSMGAIGTQ
jgi:hypothetical protein